MAVQELRKFKFFDLNTDVDNGALASALKDTTLTVATSGHNYLIFGDGEGNIVFLNKLFEATIFKAYNLSISHAEYIKHSSFLITVGEDEPGINPLLKVWNVDMTDKGGNPKCVRVTRLIPNQTAVPVTAVGVHESANFLAFGFQNGSILLLRGYVTRDRSSKPKLLKDSGSSAITGLAFRTTAMPSHYLFVTTEHSVVVYDCTTKDKENKCHLDSEGCSIGCSIMAELPHEAHFVVARHDAMYCYTLDGKGPCYAMGGNKVLIQWSKSFLVIVAKEDKAAQVNAIGPSMSLASETSKDTHTVTVLDFHNNLIVSTSVLPEVKAVLVECGSFYIVTSDQRVHHLVEKDVQSKLALLFKKNLYDVAIRMAKSQHYDEDGLVDIFRQYGDHLNAKGDRVGAIEQYIKTIGKLEPSYIIRKFMDSAHMEQLMEYLQALHRKGLATGDHTTLLLNCYIKLGRATDLKDFIMTKGRKVDFDIEIALKVVRGVNPEDALSLAKAHGRHLWVLRILLEDMKKYQEAINYMSGLEFCDAGKCILDFGGILMEQSPAEITSFLKELCSKQLDEQVQVPAARDINVFDLDAGPATPKPQDFLHLFLLKSEYLVDFLEHLVNNRTGLDSQIYNTLIEHYLVLWKKNREGSRSNIELRLMKLLQNPDARYDRDHVFLLCQMYDFAPGRIFLYEENKMYYQVVQAHMEQKNYKGVLAACRRFGNQDPNIWIQALWAATRHAETPHHVLSEILAVIEKESLQPPVMTMEALQEGTTLGQARRYLAAVLQAEDALVALETALIDKCSAETARVRKHTQDIENSTVIFQGSRCSICNRQLELPSVHFLCQHSFHQHCLQGYAENENECIVCLKDNKVLLDMIASQEKNHELHEAFHGQLEKADDGFAVVADYFGRGVFNKVNIAAPNASPVPANIPAIAPRVVPSHQQERPEPKQMTTSRMSVPGARDAEEQEIARSLTHPAPSDSYRRTPEPSSLATSTYKTPFDDDDDDEDYDTTKNPFEVEDESNPFASDRRPDYDNDLNPFE